MKKVVAFLLRLPIVRSIAGAIAASRARKERGRRFRAGISEPMAPPPWADIPPASYDDGWSRVSSGLRPHPGAFSPKDPVVRGSITPEQANAPRRFTH